MNNFATIKHIASNRKVEYYSICMDEDISLFELFLQKHTRENFEKLDHIMNWVNEIGNIYGAQEKHFRNEAETADARALPPKGIDTEPTYVELNNETGKEENTPNNLRLYCFRANDSVVFLFNGDIKTANLAQDCDNVRPHFRLANKLTELLEEAWNNDIKWNRDFSDISYDDDFELNW